MRFMLLLKSDKRTEAGASASDQFSAAIDSYTNELANAGKLLAAERLSPSINGARLRLADGERTLTKGPFGEPEKLVAGYWIIQANSRDEAIEWAKRVPFEAGEGPTGQVEVRQVYEIDDFPVNEDESGWREQEAAVRAASPDGMSYAFPQPTRGGSPLKRFFCISPCTAESEAGIPPSEKVLAAVGEYSADMAAAGLMLGGEGLQPSSNGARVTYSEGTRVVTDGPFMETKELVGGFAIIQATSLDDVVDLSWRFLEVIGDAPGEERRCEIREIILPS